MCFFGPWLCLLLCFSSGPLKSHNLLICNFFYYLNWQKIDCKCPTIIAITTPSDNPLLKFALHLLIVNVSSPHPSCIDAKWSHPPTSVTVTRWTLQSSLIVVTQCNKREAGAPLRKTGDMENWSEAENQSKPVMHNDGWKLALCNNGLQNRQRNHPFQIKGWNCHTWSDRLG